MQARPKPPAPKEASSRNPTHQTPIDTASVDTAPVESIAADRRSARRPTAALSVLKILVLLLIIAALGAGGAGATVMSSGDACAGPSGPVSPTLESGQICEWSAQCLSGYCVPDGEVARCAALTLDGRCVEGNEPALVRACDGGECNRPLRQICLPAETSPTCAPSCEPGGNCWRDGDCDSGACLRPPSGAAGTCVEPCRNPAALSDLSPHLCQAGASQTCVEGPTDRGPFCLPSSFSPAVLDVDLFGASTVDPVQPSAFDSGPALNLALISAEHGASGGQVCLRSGDYFVDQNLQIGDDTTLFGQGLRSTLHRGPNLADSDPCTGQLDCTCAHPGLSGSLLITNRQYGCGNRGITLRDFAVDGSLVEPQFTITGELFPMVTLAFSATQDTLIEGLHLRNAPQDAIFFRNGGVDNEVRNTTIDGFGLKWFNGAGINVEMQPGPVAPAGVTVPESRKANLKITGNRIIARSPKTFCSARRTPCESDLDCPPAEACSLDAQVDAINVNVATDYFIGFDLGDPREDYSSLSFPKPTLEGNVIVSDGAPAFRCFGCTDTVVEGNCLAPLLPGQNAATTAARCASCLENPNTCDQVPTGQGAGFTGIWLEQTAETNQIDPALGNFTVRQNRLFGGGGGQPIRVQSDHPQASGVLISDNAIAEWYAGWDANQQASIEVLGFSDVGVYENRIAGACTLLTGAEPCLGGEAGGIHVNGWGNQVGRGAYVEANRVRGKELHTGARGILVRNFRQPSPGQSTAFTVESNQLLCLGGPGYALYLGDEGQHGPGIPYTRDGSIRGNEVQLEAGGSLVCHPQITHASANSIYCRHTCDLSFDANLLDPAGIQGECFGLCPAEGAP